MRAVKEEIVFNGSSVHRHKILEWLKTDNKFDGDMSDTKDNVILTLPNRVNLSRGDVVIKYSKDNYDVKKYR